MKIDALQSIYTASKFIFLVTYDLTDYFYTAEWLQSLPRKKLDEILSSCSFLILNFNFVMFALSYYF